MVYYRSRDRDYRGKDRDRDYRGRDSDRDIEEVVFVWWL
jgi:hypothetical protein